MFATMAASRRPSVGQSGPTAPTPKPRDEDLDFFGLTHPGKVRRENQDHFLLCTLHKSMRVRSTSLPNPEQLELPGQRLASVGLVADGVGGRAGGETASRAAVEAVASYVTNAMNCYYTADPRDEAVFLEALREAARQSHEAVLERARQSGEGGEQGGRGMATTLTLVLAVWPMLYILQVGDSRCYRLRNGVLEQLTRDQTMAQDLVDQGVLAAANVHRSPFANVLSSSIGRRAVPAVSRAQIEPGDVYLLCSDGLTKHVPDERIRDHLGGLTSSEQACHDLVAAALAGGGRDNVTVVVMRAVLRSA